MIIVPSYLIWQVENHDRLMISFLSLCCWRQFHWVLITATLNYRSNFAYHTSLSWSSTVKCYTRSLITNTRLVTWHFLDLKWILSPRIINLNLGITAKFTSIGGSEKFTHIEFWSQWHGPPNLSCLPNKQRPVLDRYYALSLNGQALPFSHKMSHHARTAESTVWSSYTTFRICKSLEDWNGRHDNKGGVDGVVCLEKFVLNFNGKKVKKRSRSKTLLLLTGVQSHCPFSGPNYRGTFREPAWWTLKSMGYNGFGQLS